MNSDALHSGIQSASQIARTLARLNQVKVGLKSRISSKKTTSSNHRLQQTLKTLEATVSGHDGKSESPTSKMDPDLADINLIGKIVVGNNHFSSNTQYQSRENTLLKGQISQQSQKVPADIGHKIFKRRQIEQATKKSQKSNASFHTHLLSSTSYHPRIADLSEEMENLRGAIYKDSFSIDEGQQKKKLAEKKTAKKPNQVQSLSYKKAEVVEKLLRQYQSDQVQSIIDLNQHLKTRVEDINMSDHVSGYRMNSLARGIRKMSQGQAKKRPKVGESLIGLVENGVSPKKHAEAKHSRSINYGVRKQSVLDKLTKQTFKEAKLSKQENRVKRRDRYGPMRSKENLGGVAFMQLNLKDSHQEDPVRFIKLSSKTPKQSVNRKALMSQSNFEMTGSLKQQKASPYIDTRQMSMKPISADLTSYIQSLQKDSNSSTFRVLNFVKPAEVSQPNFEMKIGKQISPLTIKKKPRYQSAYSRKAPLIPSHYITNKYGDPLESCRKTLNKETASLLSQQLQKQEQRTVRQRLTQCQINDDLADIMVHQQNEQTRYRKSEIPLETEPSIMKLPASSLAAGKEANLKLMLRVNQALESKFESSISKKVTPAQLGQISHLKDDGFTAEVRLCLDQATKQQEEGLLTERRILQSARDGSYTVAQASSRGDCLHLKSREDAIHNIQSFEKVLLEKQLHTQEVESPKDEDFNTVEEIPETKEEDLQPIIEGLSQQAKDKESVKQADEDLYSVLDQSINNMKSQPTNLQTPQQKKSIENDSIHSAYNLSKKLTQIRGSLDKKQQSFSRQRSMKRASKLSHSSKARRHSVDSIGNSSVKRAKKSSNKRIIEEEQFKSNVYDCIHIQPEQPKQPKPVLKQPSFHKQLSIQKQQSSIKQSIQIADSKKKKKPKTRADSVLKIAINANTDLKQESPEKVLTLKPEISKPRPVSSKSPRKKPSAAVKLGQKLSEFISKNKVSLDLDKYWDLYHEITAFLKENYQDSQKMLELDKFSKEGSKLESKLPSFLQMGKFHEKLSALDEWVEVLGIECVEAHKIQKIFSEKLLQLCQPRQPRGQSAGASTKQSKKGKRNAQETTKQQAGGCDIDSPRDLLAKPQHHLEILEHLLQPNSFISIWKTHFRFKQLQDDPSIESSILPNVSQILKLIVVQAFRQNRESTPEERHLAIYMLSYKDQSSDEIIAELLTALPTAALHELAFKAKYPDSIQDQFISTNICPNHHDGVHAQSLIQAELDSRDKKKKKQEFTLKLQLSKADTFVRKKTEGFNDYEQKVDETESQYSKMSRLKPGKSRGKKKGKKTASRLKSGKRRMDAKIKVITSSEVNIFKAEHNIQAQSALAADRINELKCLDLDLEFGFEDDEEEEQIYPVVTRNDQTCHNSQSNYYHTFHQEDTQNQNSQEHKSLLNNVSFTNNPDSYVPTKGEVDHPPYLLTENDYSTEQYKRKSENQIESKKSGKSQVRVISFPLKAQSKSSSNTAFQEGKNERQAVFQKYELGIQENTSFAEITNQQPTETPQIGEVFSPQDPEIKIKKEDIEFYINNPPSNRNVRPAIVDIPTDNHNLAYLMEDLKKMEDEEQQAPSIPTTTSECYRPMSGNVQSLMMQQINKSKLNAQPQRKSRLMSANPQRRKDESSGSYELTNFSMSDLKSSQARPKPAKQLSQTMISSKQVKDPKVTAYLNRLQRGEDAVSRRSSFLKTYKQFMQVIKEERK